MTDSKRSNDLLRLAQIALSDPKAVRAAIKRRRELDDLRRECATLPGFIKTFWPILEPGTQLDFGWVHEAMAKHLEAVSEGDIKRLLINVPPGFMKSLMVSVFWPAFMWGPMGQPGLRFLTTSWSETIATRDARKMRELVDSPLYQALYGSLVGTIRGGGTDFENAAKGWRRSRAIGSLTGERGDVVIVDDPHSTVTADSDARREHTLRVMREQVPTRLNHQKHSKIVVIMQRLHEDDVSGYLLRNDPDYVHLCLPMRYEADRACSTLLGFKDPRTEDGELLDPVRFDEKRVAKLEFDLGEYAAAGQLQQRPAPRDGAMFKRDWFEVVDSVPEGGMQVRAWDIGGGKSINGSEPDWTVGLMGKKGRDGYLYVMDMVRVRAGSGELMKTIESTARNDGRGVKQRFPQDPGAAGKILGEYMKDTLYRLGYQAILTRVTEDKFVRALPACTTAEQGRIRLVRAPWNDPFINEVCTFPTGRFDDVVDAFSDLHHELTRFDSYDLSNVC